MQQNTFGILSSFACILKKRRFLEENRPNNTKNTSEVHVEKQEKNRVQQRLQKTFCIIKPAVFLTTMYCII